KNFDKQIHCLYSNDINISSNRRNIIISVRLLLIEYDSENRMNTNRNHSSRRLRLKKTARTLIVIIRFAGYCAISKIPNLKTTDLHALTNGAGLSGERNRQVEWRGAST